MELMHMKVQLEFAGGAGAINYPRICIALRESHCFPLTDSAFEVLE